MRVPGLTHRRVMYLLVGATMLLAIFTLPLQLLRLPNPRPVKVAGIAEAVRGVYLQTPDGLYHLFPGAMRLDEFPLEQALITDGQVSILIKARVFDEARRYRLYEYTTNRAIPLVPHRDATQVLRLTPSQQLPVGEYYLEMPRESAYGGLDYYYFRVCP